MSSDLEKNLAEQQQAAARLHNPGDCPTFLLRLWISDLMAEEAFIRREFAVIRGEAARRCCCPS